MTVSLGGWIAALLIGAILLIIAPHVPPPGGKICKIIGMVALAIGAVLFVLWLVALVTGSV